VDELDTTPPEEGVHLTPGQLLARIDAASRKDRLDLAAAMLGAVEAADRCWSLNHDSLMAELDFLAGEVRRLRSENVKLLAAQQQRRPARLAVDGHAYRRRTRARTRRRGRA
jgi:multidrug resistance efflux pump